MSERLSILIAGATGFIGGRLASKLGDAGHRIRCLVRDAARAEDLRRLRPSGAAPFDVARTPFEETLRRALAEELPG